MKQLRQAIEQIVSDLAVDVTVELTRPEPQFGDFSSNIAMKLAQRLQQNPRDIASDIAQKLSDHPVVASVDVAGSGFLNIRLSDEALLELVDQTPVAKLQGQVIVTEYSDPNPFKVLHAGHLYTTLVGDAISRLLERSGARVHRVNFGGDVGPHVARNLWAIVKKLQGEYPQKLESIPGDLHDKANWLSARYVEGNDAYETSEQARREIIEYNKRIYDIHTQNDHESDFARLYWIGRQWSYDYFELLYRELGVIPFEKYYPESATTPTGVEAVNQGLRDGVYEKSNGAVVFRGESYGLHTRVFINQQGLPTYETKDVGLILQKWSDYQFDQSIVITGNDIVEYMKVVQKSIEQFEPELVKRSRHLTHGNIKLAGGKKMSSRKGTVVLALDVLESARRANQESNGKTDELVSLGAIKYAFLRQRIGADIIYDPQESVSLHGNSGPYLQYAHARACSILAKADNEPKLIGPLEAGERLLVQKLGEYAEVIEQATDELMPHYLCNYLYELSQTFNRFYETNRVIGNDRQSIRLALVDRYRQTLADGLGLLGIVAPEKL